jgi:selenocysteine-specific elongation factor
MIVRAGPLVLAASEWQRLRDDSVGTLGSYHQRFPLRPGMPREEWRSRLGLSPRVSAEVVPALLAAGDLAEAPGGRGAPLMLPSHVPTLSVDQERAVATLLERFRAAPFSPPTRPDVEAELGAELTAALVERGTLVAIGAVLLTPDAYTEAIRRFATYFGEHGTLTVAAARDLLGTTRKYMLPILEHFDERRITLRQGDDRVAGPNLRTRAVTAARAGGAPGN